MKNEEKTRYEKKKKKKESSLEQLKRKLADVDLLGFRTKKID
jgi:hypothetical protein